MKKDIYNNELLLKYLYYYRDLNKTDIQNLLGIGRKRLDYYLTKYKLTKNSEESNFIKFLNKIDISSPNKCWEYPEILDDHYGTATLNGQTIPAHRFSAYFFLNFDLNSEFFICHKCDNKRCVNPHHLFVGTCADNMQDLVNKDKQRRGTQINTNRLTEKQVNEIKKLYTTGKYSWKNLGILFNVSKPTIGAILKKRNWKWLEKEQGIK